MGARHLPFILFLSAFLVAGKAEGQLERYKKFTDSLISVLSFEKNDSARALILMNITEKKMGQAQNNGNWREAIEWANKTMTAALKAKYEYVYGRVNIRLGQSFVQAGKYNEAIKYLYNALNLSLNNNNLNLRHAAYRNLSACYSSLQNLDEALKMDMAAYETAKKTNANQDGRLKQTAAEISSLYLSQKNYEQALLWNQKALPADPQAFYEGALELQQAEILLALNEKEKAVATLKNVVTLFPERWKRKEKDYQGLVGSWQMEYGALFIKLAELTQGEESRSYYLKANEHLKKSIPLLENQSGGYGPLMSAYELLQKSSEHLGDYVNSLRYHQLYDTVKDSVFNQKTYAEVSNLRVKFETEKVAAEMQAKRETERIKEEAENAKLLSDQQLKQEQLLAEEKLTHQQQVAQQQLEQQKILADVRLRNEKAIEEEKRKEALIRADKERTNNILLMGLALTIISGFFIIMYNRQKNQKRRAIEHAEAVHKMAELELQSLRSQLNPHFMFNSLTSIQELILKEENDKSHLYLSRFAKLLRMLLENADKPFIPLQKELEFVKLYIELENLRVPDLKYSIRTDENLDMQNIMIPNMMLQPYIENAIWHGLSAKKDDKHLSIRVYRENGSINYEIEDNGIGRKKAVEMKRQHREKHESKGMDILNKRFELLGQEFGSKIITTISDVENGHGDNGTLVQIKVPVNLSQPVLN